MSTAAQIEKQITDYIELKKKAVLIALDNEVHKSIDINFQQSGRPRWTPSKKLGKRPGAKTLQESGHLRSVGSNIDYVNSRVVFGLNPNARVYGQIHNEGGIINHPGRQKKDGSRGNAYQIRMPQRRFMVIPEADFPRILNTIRKLF